MMTKEEFKALMRYDGDVTQYKASVTQWVYFLVTVFVARYAYQIWHGGEGYKTGDWLINYEGGFIRRGLIGELLFGLSSLGLDLLWTTYVVQSAVYFALAYLILDVFFAKKHQLSALLFIFSPAFIFLFPFYCIPGGFRKEILVFLPFVLLVWGLIKGKDIQAVAISALLLYVLAIFSHEMAVFGLPYFIYVLYLHSNRHPEHKVMSRILIVLFVVVAAGGLLASMRYHGDVETLKAMTASLESRGILPSAFDGSISYLDDTMSSAVHSVVEAIKHNHYDGYLHSVALSIIPVIYFGYHKRHWPILLISFVFLLPLFAVGLDWGRWIAFWMFFAYVHWMFEGGDGIERRLPLYWVLLYAMTWSLNHFGSGSLGLGIREVFR